ncbi:MAG TPA: class D sortase [Anaerolineales bacterium]|nr:class D sortase [Anaerolineales bacterium]
MAKSKPADELSVEELRWLLMEKRRAARQQRLERYRRTGRTVVIAPDVDNSFGDLHSGVIDDSQPGENDQAISRRRSRRILDVLLLIVEVGAVLGLILVLFNGLGLLQELNREVASVLEQPTLTPTPLIMAVVLPSGHTPPNALGGARPNEAEIPEHLRPLVQSLANLPLPTPGPEQAIRIQISKIKVDAPVVQGDGWEQLKKGVGQHIGSSNPGKTGNVVLSAHNDIFGEIFRDLDQLQAGDQIVLFTNQSVYTYAVVDSQVVEPTSVEFMAPTAQPTVTLISCYPYLVDNQRIVVSARLLSGSE